ncbi:MAG: hypothetical protein KC425_24270 [Anaerolineales bacterium]|nr:hypothetical protein [Anaerolineales bacterium]
MSDPSNNSELPEPGTVLAAQLAELDPFLRQLPNPVQLHYWGLEDASPEEKEALRLCRALADAYDVLSLRTFSRRASYPYYPVLGFMGLDGEKKIDYGLRIIGLPAGYQLTSLIAAIQAVSFQGVTLEPVTRIKLKQLQTDVKLELITSTDDEAGPAVAKTLFGLAVAHPQVKSYVVMANMFPEAAYRYSAYTLPHLVINGRIHLSGPADEDQIVRHVGLAAKQAHTT